MGDTPRDEGERAEVMRKVVLVFLFYVLNIAMNAYNKYLFTVPTEGKTGAGFNVPVFASMTHAVAGFIYAGTVARFVPSMYTRTILDRRMWVVVVGISVFFAGSIGLNNSSLQYLALSTQQVIRSASPAVVAVCAFFIDHKTLSHSQIASLCVLVIGVALAVSGGGGDKATHTIGVVLCFGSVLAGALQYTYVAVTMSNKNRLSPFDLLLYTSIPIVIIMTPFMILNDEPTKLAVYVDNHGAATAVGWILIGQVMAVCYNLTVYYFIRAMSAVYIAVCGVFKVVLIILFSIIVMGDTVAWVNGLGLVLALTGFGFNSYFQFQSKQAAPPPAAPAPAASSESKAQGWGQLEDGESANEEQPLLSEEGGEGKGEEGKA